MVMKNTFNNINILKMELYETALVDSKVTNVYVLQLPKNSNSLPLFLFISNRNLKASRAPLKSQAQGHQAYSRALHQIRGIVQRIVRGRLRQGIF